MLTLLLLASLAVSEPSPGEALAAVYKSGSLTVAELERWQRYQALQGGRGDERQAVEDLVVVEALAARLPPEQATSPELALERRFLEIRAADAWLERWLRREAEPTEEQLKAEFSRDPARYHRPKRWRLSNLLVRVPEDASEIERASRRKEAEDLLHQLQQEADFGELAESTSDSETRLRRGDMGFVTLAKLQPAVARVVADLKVDTLSPVVEIRDGFLILLCTAVQEAEERTFTEARQRIAGRLRTRAIEASKAKLEASLLAELAIRIGAGASWKDPDAVVATYQLDGKTRTLEVHELGLFARKPRSKPLDQLSPTKRAEAIESYLLAMARAAEAIRKGCMDDPDHELRLHYRTLELQAQKAANQAADAALKPPEEAAISAWIEARRENLDFPATSHVRALVVHRNPGYGAEFFARLRRAGERLEAEGGSLEAVARELAPHAEVQDFGWLTESQVWTLGRNLDLTWKAMATGSFSSLVQEGPKLYLLERAGDKPRRPLSRAEAQQQAQAALLAAERRRFGQELRRSILREESIELTP